MGAPGISIFDLQARIGHASPELHACFPRRLSIRQVVESAWADSFNSKPRLTHERDVLVDTHLRWFQQQLDPQLAFSASSSSSSLLPDPIDALIPTQICEEGQTPAAERSHGQHKSIVKRYRESDVDWADTATFGQASHSAQRVALFLRAIIKKPDLVILDEAFSGMDPLARDKCLLFLTHGESRWWRRDTRRFCQVLTLKARTFMARSGTCLVTGLEERQALLCISHRAEEVPFIVDEYLKLPEPGDGKSVRFGPIDRSQPEDWWAEIWNA